MIEDLSPGWTNHEADLALATCRRGGANRIAGVGVIGWAIATAVAMKSHGTGILVSGLMVRDEKKDHGEKVRINGSDIKAGDTAVLLVGPEVSWPEVMEAQQILSNDGCEVVFLHQIRRGEPPR